MVDPTSLIAAAKEVGILNEVYKDLAQPGVRQVGLALETVLQLGSSVLMPIRLLNETARQFEKRKFDAIAERFSKIPEDNVIDVSPEIGVPIMEKLSITQDDTLKRMFVELLAKAADSATVSKAHPSFVNVIASLCPDEALLLESMKGARYHPFVSIDLKELAGAGKTTPHEIVIEPPENLAFPQNIPLYISNLIGLGVVEARRNTKLTAPGSYARVEQYAKTFGFGDNFVVSGSTRKVEYGRHILVVLPYGEAFIEACNSS